MRVLQAKAWREAATIMLISKWTCVQNGNSLKADANKLLEDMVGQSAASYLKGRTYDYRVLLLKRSGKSSFMPNALVFPGGAIDKADLSLEWWDVFERVGISRNRLKKLSDVQSARPLWTKNLPVIDGKTDQIGTSAAEGLPLDIAFRLCAIRETFEESGVFLGRTKSEIGTGNAESIGTVYEPPKDRTNDFVDWKKKVRKDAHKFLDMCRDCDVCPDVLALHEWSDWLTPIHFPQRFDTMFYTCCVEKIPDVSLDMKEIKDMQWCTPIEALIEHLQRKIWLPPPQFIELLRLAQIDSFSKLAQFVYERRQEGVETLLPVKIQATDGMLQLMPGDELYPTDPDYFGKGPELSTNKTVEELNESSTRINRLVMGNDNAFHVTKILCNVIFSFGQLNPCEIGRRTN